MRSSSVSRHVYIMIMLFLKLALKNPPTWCTKDVKQRSGKHKKKKKWNGEYSRKGRQGKSFYNSPKLSPNRGSAFLTFHAQRHFSLCEKYWNLHIVPDRVALPLSRITSAVRSEWSPVTTQSAHVSPYLGHTNWETTSMLNGIITPLSARPPLTFHALLTDFSKVFCGQTF